MTTILPLTLGLTAAVAAGIGFIIWRRREVPGSGAMLGLMASIFVWAATSAMHALAPSLDARIAWAKVQYLGIANAAPFWLLFTATYAQAPWAGRRGVRVALWIPPVITIVAAATNEWHGAVWPSVTLASNGGAVYEHGWWFWIATAYMYGLMVAGTVILLRALASSPPTFRVQWMALIVAGVTPYVGNGLYLTGLMPPGIDLTPAAFAVSGLLLTYGIYRGRFLDLVPVARDVVLENMSDAVFVIDGARRILDMNAAARELAGNPSNWVGRPVAAVAPILIGLRLDGAADASTTLAWPAGDGSGETRFYDARVLRVRDRQGRAGARVVLARDVTARLRIEAERAALQQRVQEQEKRESLSVLAGGLAHDFNNLLTGIVGNADLLSLQIPPSSELGSNVGAILLAAQRAADLVDKMLAYAGERHGTIERVDLDVVVGEMIDLLRASAARHCTLRYSGLSAIIDADPTQLRQVVMNLIINATEAVEEGHGEIVVTTGRETLTRAQLAEASCADEAAPGDFAFLDVTDNGIGMDEATLARIFQPFYTTKPTGHGLGLAAVQGIVYGHRGALRVRSVRGHGTSFRVWLPLAGNTPPPNPRGNRHAVEPSAVRRTSGT